MFEAEHAVRKTINRMKEREMTEPTTNIFPSQAQLELAKEAREPTQVVTLRDQFAIAALTGFCANPELRHWDFKAAAVAARKQADAMMKAREGGE